MKQLTALEMDSISGGYSWDFSSVSSTVMCVVGNSIQATASAVLAGATAGITGSIIGGTKGGNGGGVLGFGSAAAGVGMIWGLIVGIVGGAVTGVAIGWEETQSKCLSMFDGYINGTLTPWAASNKNTITIN